MIKVTCPHCSIQILVPDTVQGREGVCFGCGEPLTVPRAEQDLFERELAFKKGERVAERYVVQEQLGKGGMGVVYGAHDTLIGEPVALKFLNPRLLRTQRGQRMFIQEAQVARRLRHEHIVAVHDVATTTEGVLYLSMELLRGQSLRNLLRKHREERRLVDVRLVVSVVSQTLKALEYAHRTVVHRDVKPENVMVLPGERVKALDFGLAKALDEGEVQRKDLRVNSKRVVGTYAYAAPEQKRHHGIDFRADIYATGLVLREMFTLRVPLEEQVEVPRVRDDVAPGILQVMNKALQEDKELRWQSAAEFRTNLEREFKEAYRLDQVEVATDDGRKVSTEGMVYLEGGSFLMGNNGVREEKPEFEAHVEPFYMDMFPVLVSQYRAFLQETGYREPKYWRNGDFNGPDQPITGVAWADAQAYAAWAGKQLPTEAQWEFAARGKENRRYPWGSLEPDTTLCNFGDYLNMPSIVTMHEKGQTPDGLYDMGGNVFEWTLGLYAPYSPEHNGAPPNSRTPRRVARGGSWHSPPDELRCSFRKGLFPDVQLTTVGFRCVLPAARAIKQG